MELGFFFSLRFCELRKCFFLLMILLYNLEGILFNFLFIILMEFIINGYIVFVCKFLGIMNL